MKTDSTLVNDSVETSSAASTDTTALVNVGDLMTTPIPTQKKEKKEKKEKVNSARSWPKKEKATVVDLAAAEKVMSETTSETVTGTHTETDTAPITTPVTKAVTTPVTKAVTKTISKDDFVPFGWLLNDLIISKTLSFEFDVGGKKFIAFSEKGDDRIGVYHGSQSLGFLFIGVFNQDPKMNSYSDLDFTAGFIPGLRLLFTPTDIASGGPIKIDFMKSFGFLMKEFIRAAVQSSLKELGKLYRSVAVSEIIYLNPIQKHMIIRTEFRVAFSSFGFIHESGSSVIKVNDQFNVDTHFGVIEISGAIPKWCPSVLEESEKVIYLRTKCPHGDMNGVCRNLINNVLTKLGKTDGRPTLGETTSVLEDFEMN